jgi:RNA recognition motif-containing protein
MQGKKLYVGNLRHDVTNEDLRQLFSSMGEVVNVNILTGRGFGFIEMATSQEAEQAIESLDGTDFNGRLLKINEARPMVRKDKDGDGRKNRRRF